MESDKENRRKDAKPQQPKENKMQASRESLVEDHGELVGLSPPVSYLRWDRTG